MLVDIFSFTITNKMKVKQTHVRIRLIIKLLFMVSFCDPIVGDRTINTESGCGKK